MCGHQIAAPNFREPYSDQGGRMAEEAYRGGKTAPWREAIGYASQELIFEGQKSNRPLADVQLNASCTKFKLI